MHAPHRARVPRADVLAVGARERDVLGIAVVDLALELERAQADAPWNMVFMKATELVSQVEMSPLKLDASSNMPSMLMTELVSQVEMSPLNLDALWNMQAMLVTTELISQRDRFWSKE
eukprot:3933640-Rhodomonas_salina.3